MNSRVPESRPNPRSKNRPRPLRKRQPRNRRTPKCPRRTATPRRSTTWSSMSWIWKSVIRRPTKSSASRTSLKDFRRSRPSKPSKRDGAPIGRRRAGQRSPIDDGRREEPDSDGSSRFSFLALRRSPSRRAPLPCRRAGSVRTTCSSRRLVFGVVDGGNNELLGGFLGQRGFPLANADMHRAGGRPAAGKRSFSAERQAAVAQVTQEFGGLIENAHEPEGPARFPVRERPTARMPHRPVARGNRVAMRIDRREAKIFVNAVDQQIADGMFHVLRFVVDFVPRQVERPDEEQFDQAMPAQDAQSQQSAGFR